MADRGRARRGSGGLWLAWGLAGVIALVVIIMALMTFEVSPFGDDEEEEADVELVQGEPDEQPELEVEIEGGADGVEEIDDVVVDVPAEADELPGEGGEVELPGGAETDDEAALPGRRAAARATRSSFIAT